MVFSLKNQGKEVFQCVYLHKGDVVKSYKIGIYETTYGNAAEYNPDEYGEFNAWDLDMREEIPVEMIDFDKFIRELD